MTEAAAIDHDSAHAAVDLLLDAVTGCDFARIEEAAQHCATSLYRHRHPTDKQLVAGNYKLGRAGALGRASVKGIPVSIENPRGSVRSGTDPGGKRWSSRMAAHYGFIDGTRGADGDEIDCFIGPWPEAQYAYVINQRKVGAGTFDEHKVMFGFADEDAAKRAYLSSYERGWTGFMSMTRVTFKQLRWWMRNGNTGRALEIGHLPFDGENTVMDDTSEILFDSAAGVGFAPRALRTFAWREDLPVAATMAQVFYHLQSSDADLGQLMDSVTMAEIEADCDHVIDDTVRYDALVVEAKRIERTGNALLRVLGKAGTTLKPTSVSVSKPMSRNGAVNQAILLNLSDGQTLAIWFHNPDSTPNKLKPDDELVSWKWLLNKKDVTIAVAPERGKDLDLVVVARRIMALAEKNAGAFAKTRANVEAAQAERTDLQAQVAEKTATLEGLVTAIETRKAEIAKGESEPAPAPTPEPAQVPEPEPAPVEPEPPQSASEIVAELPDAYGNTVVVAKISNGWSVTIRENESGAYLGAANIYPDEAWAMRAARNIAAGRPAGAADEPPASPEPAPAAAEPTPEPQPAPTPDPAPPEPAENPAPPEPQPEPTPEPQPVPAPETEPAPATAPEPTPTPDPAPATKRDAAEAMAKLGTLLGRSQRAAVGQLMQGEEGQFFKDKMVELAGIAETMPKTYGQDGMGDNAVAYLHYFRGGSDWYITERDRGSPEDTPEDRDSQCFGFVVLNGDVDNAELGYISIPELTGLGVELDFHWTPKTIGEIKRSHGIGADPEPAPPANDPPPANDAPVVTEAQAVSTLNGDADSADAEVAFLRSVIGGDAVPSGPEVAKQIKAIAKNRPDLAAMVQDAARAYSARVIANAKQALAA